MLTYKQPATFVQQYMTCMHCQAATFVEQDMTCMHCQAATFVEEDMTWMHCEAAAPARFCTVFTGFSYYPTTCALAVSSPSSLQLQLLSQFWGLSLCNFTGCYS